MPLCSQPFFFKRFSRAPFFFWGGITHTQAVWVLRKPSGFQETSLCLSSGLLLDPPSGLCDVRLWPSREMQWSRNRAAEEHDATQIDDLSSSPKKAWKQTNHWLVCGKKHQKNLGLNLFLCVRKVDYITTSFKTNMELPTWNFPLRLDLNRFSFLRILTKIPGGFTPAGYQPFWPRKKSLASERSRNPLWVAIQIHTFQMPISHSCLGLKNKLQFAVFFWFWTFFAGFGFFFFLANGQQENSPEKQQKRFLVSFLLIIWGPTPSWRPTSPRTCVWTAVDSTSEEKRMGS